jgi:hypothetical protein
MLGIMNRFLTFYYVITKLLEFRWEKHVSTVETESHCALLRGTRFPLCVPLLELLYHSKDSERMTESRATGCVSSLRCSPCNRLVKAKLSGQGTLRV